MIEEWRIFLYYPLGILAWFFFTLRILVQWLKSEKAGFSFVNETFWRLSFTGNLLLFLHYAVQAQYPFALVQVGNALISWRNLNLMAEKLSFSLKQTIIIFTAALIGSGGLLFLVGFFTNTQWVSIPKSSLSEPANDPGFLWHGLGLLGQGLFSSRFWLQWWFCEKNKKSELGVVFWWISLVGSFLSSVYFLKIHDVISFFSQAFGIIPYLRNLILIRNSRAASRI